MTSSTPRSGVTDEATPEATTYAVEPLSASGQSEGGPAGGDQSGGGPAGGALHGGLVHLGSGDAAVCEDGFCWVPETTSD